MASPTAVQDLQRLRHDGWLDQEGGGRSVRSSPRAGCRRLVGVSAAVKCRAMTVNEFIKSNVLPEYRPVVAAVRSLMKEHAPGAKEMMSYGLPMYIQRLTIAWISPSKTGIKLSFMRGAAFEDKYGLLGGTANHARYVKLKKVGEVSKPALRHYIKQALKYDKL